MKIIPNACAGLIAATVLIGSASLLHAQAAGVCVYESKNYSEGASICPRQSLMLSCRVEGTRMVWTIVADQDTKRLCSSPVVSRFHRRPVRARLHREASPARPAAAAAAAKCFHFNGKTYCE